MSKRPEPDMVSFLLNLQSSEDRERVEIRMLEDDSYFEQLLASEEALIEDYMSGRLSVKDFLRFEQVCHDSPQRQRRVRLAELLRDRFKTPDEPSQPQEANTEDQAEVILQEVILQSVMTGEPAQAAALVGSARQLITELYPELHSIAARYIQQESVGRHIDASALIVETLTRLMAVEPNQWESRAHLIAIASHLMRRILVDEARRARAERRQPITLDLKNPSRPDTRQPSDVIALDEAITRLAKLDSRQSRIVEMYYFGGMTSAEIAAVWDLSARTVERELHLASAALRRILMMPG